MSSPPIEISLRFDQAIYLTGQCVTGKISAIVRQPLKACVLVVSLRGNHIFKTDSLPDIDKFCRKATSLHFGDSPSVDEGEHEVTFSIELDQGLPSSLESHVVTTSYEVVAVTTICLENGDTLKFFEKHPISINRLCDLNQIETSGKMVTSTWNMLYCCFGSTLTATLETKRTGYVAGEMIFVSANISNLSPTPILKISLSLFQKVKTKANRTAKFIVAYKERGAIDAYSPRIIDEVLKVPSLPCSSKDSDVTIKYFLQLNIVREGRILKLKLPVVIGNYPLESILPTVREVRQGITYSSAGGTGDAPQPVFQPNYVIYHFD